MLQPRRLVLRHQLVQGGGQPRRLRLNVAEAALRRLPACCGGREEALSQGDLRVLALEGPAVLVVAGGSLGGGLPGLGLSLVEAGGQLLDPLPLEVELRDGLGQHRAHLAVLDPRQLQVRHLRLKALARRSDQPKVALRRLPLVGLPLQPRLGGRQVRAHAFPLVRPRSADLADNTQALGDGGLHRCDQGFLRAASVGKCCRTAVPEERVFSLQRLPLPPFGRPFSIHAPLLLFTGAALEFESSRCVLQLASQVRGFLTSGVEITGRLLQLKPRLAGRGDALRHFLARRAKLAARRRRRLPLTL